MGGKSRTTSSLVSPTNLSISLSVIRQESRMIITTNQNQVILEDKPDRSHTQDTDYSLVIPFRSHSSKTKVNNALAVIQTIRTTPQLHWSSPQN